MNEISPDTQQGAAPVSATALAGQQPNKTRTFKMRVTPDDADRLRKWAHQNELSQAEYVRFMTFGRTTYAPPNASKLEAICRQLGGIATNLNQCQRSINEAQQSGTLSVRQFEAMHNAIARGLEAWAEPLAELVKELKKIRPSQ